MSKVSFKTERKVIFKIAQKRVTRQGEGEFQDRAKMSLRQGESELQDREKTSRQW